MKLYIHPVSTTSRPIRLLIAEKKLPIEEQVVDILSGEHTKPPFSDLNPNMLVPVLEEDSFVLTESQAILQYLADKFELHDLYPTDLKKRARVNERLDWFNTNFFREYGYHVAYPQLFPHHKRQTDEAQQKTLEWGSERAQAALKILDQHIIGPDHDYTCGDTMTIADLSGVCMVTVGEALRVDFEKLPNVRRWIAAMKKLGSWDSINETLYGFAESVKDQEFVTP